MGLLYQFLQNFIVFCAILHNGFGQDFQMRIVPDKISGLTSPASSNLTVSCWTSESFPSYKEVLLMEIAKDGQNPIAIIGHDKNLTLQTGHRTNFYADGYFQQNSSTNFLRLTVVNPTPTDAGIYSCMVYIIEGGVLKEEILKANLEVDNTNVVNDLEYLKTKLAKLEQRLQTSEETINEQNNTIAELNDMIKNHDSKLNGQDTKLKDQVMKINEQGLKIEKQDIRLGDQDTFIEYFNTTTTKLESDIEAHEKKLKSHKEKIDWETSKMTSNSDRIKSFEDIASNLTGLTTKSSEKENQAEAFTALYDRKDRFDEGDTLVFRKVQLKEGNGYDENTGIFKAPRPGLYVFHLSIATSKTNALKNVAIMVNDKPKAKLFAYDIDLYAEQSSVSCMVKLKIGDSVKAVLLHRSYVSKHLHKDPYYSIFTGYLLKELE